MSTINQEMKAILIGIILISMADSTTFCQKIGEIQEIELVLVDMPFSGDAKQANFMTLDSSEVISFNDMTWLDKHTNLYDFFHKYKDACRDSVIHFLVTMIFIPKEVYVYERYEGYKPTGELLNTWVLTSIILEVE